MGSAASAGTSQPVPFTRVMPVDELDTEKQIRCLQDEACRDATRTRETPLKLSASVEAGLNAVSIKSFYFEPTAKNWGSEHPVPPCAPSHRRHIRRMDDAARSWSAAPKEFLVDIESRRKRFDRRAELQDLEESEWHLGTSHLISRRRSGSMSKRRCRVLCM
eukprot:TRINITY_DN87363_c0_g1_i1.p1 TRINITY_DN87363_c0_g1~~TRINITY_DN87363_c0_g1_i1.p1  ORF type:complete len:173 (+),score=11.02 TRINITY_DN87363_c0_g1_i1:36-521(+)